MSRLKGLFDERRKRIVENEKITIPCYYPNASIRPAKYKVSVNLSELTSHFRQRCHSFLEKGKPDSDNGSYMDQVIDAAVQESIKLIKSQRTEHINTIQGALSDMYIGDKIGYEQELRARNDSLTEMRTKLDMINRVYYHGTSFEM